MKKNVMIAFMVLSIFSAINAGNRFASISNQVQSQWEDKVVYRVEESGKDSIAEAIVTRADVPVSFKNDDVNPWTISGEAVKNGNCGKSYSTSTLTMNYSSSYKTELTLDWRCYNYSSHSALRIFVDGVQKYSTTNSSYNLLRFYIEPGQHIIVFKDSIGNSTNTNNYSYIKNIKIKEITPLENAVLTEKSKPLHFENNGTWPWTIEDGYIQNSNYGTANSTSKFSTTFTIDKLSKFSFSRRVGYWNGNEYSTSNYSYHYFRFKINGQQYSGCNDATSFGTISVALEPGTYTMEWQDTIYNSTSTFLTQICDIELSDNWINVELSSAGTLGVEVLYLVNILKDVELLKVKGPINSTDWATIKQMTNLLAVDLSEAIVTSIPNNAFDGLSRLSNVKLPEGPTSIGSYAFRGTQILNIDIPNSVTSIGEGAFYQTRVRTVNFGPNSRLETIGYQAFYQCTSLSEFIMPNSVTKLRTYNDYNDYRSDTFNGCTALKKIIFSDALTYLPDNTCRNCSAVEELHLPNNVVSIGNDFFYAGSELKKLNLPQSIKTIGDRAFAGIHSVDSLIIPESIQSIGNHAFYNSAKISYVELSSSMSSYNQLFDGCTNIKKIVCHAATPPAIKEDPFSSATKANVTLEVPAFAVVSYKLDNYWYKFGNIIEGANTDYWRIFAGLSLTNNRRMDGKPDIDLYYGGQFVVGGNAPMETGQFNVFVSEGNPGRLLNTCEAMTADSLNTYFSVNSETWYFFTPLHDVDLTKVSVSNDASYVFRYYDGSSRATNGTGNSWRNVDNGKLFAGQGYIFRCNANAVITFPAAASVHSQVFTTSDVTKQLTAYEATASANKNWNYVGNPYPCYYDIYYMDFTAPITVWTGNTYKAYSIVDDDYALRPMQSFFVQKPDAVDNIVFHKEGRQLTSDISHVSFIRAYSAPAHVNRYFFNIQLVGDEMADETRVVVNDNASLDYEIECDASKFMSFETSVPQIFTVDASGNGYAINERPLTDGKVKLAYYAGGSAFYTISATRSDGEIYLYDSQLNKTVNLGEQDYTFHSDATEGTNNTRFVLTLKVNTGETVGITTVEDDKLNKENAIYDLLGRKVQNATKGIFIQNGHKVIKY